MTGLLASVNCLDEALLALQADADIIDLKQPQHGALGALPVDAVREIVREIGGRKPVSATVGDLPMQAETVAAAVAAMAQTGVDYVKIGLFPGGDWSGVITALQPLAQSGIRQVAVLFADTQFDTGIVDTLAAAGFTGAMLDTMDKRKGSLTSLLPAENLARFVGAVRKHPMLCGLAGSLRQEDIPLLLPLRPDYLGFRGGICRAAQRTAQLDYAALSQIRTAVRNAH